MSSIPSVYNIPIDIPFLETLAAAVLNGFPRENGGRPRPDQATYSTIASWLENALDTAAVKRPNPGKVAEFHAVDLASVEAAVAAAHTAAVQHLVYVSVAQPAPVMRAYVKAREDAETRIRASGMNATILRPWYVLGPGHWWTYLFLPSYKLLEWIPATRAAALRLETVTLEEMVAAMVNAIEASPENMRIVTVADIRRSSAIHE